MTEQERKDRAEKQALKIADDMKKVKDMCIYEVRWVLTRDKKR